ncbi:ketopantoate reductase family protein [Nocardiopsis sp. NPDC058789]|uniref:Ketopantoate reductase family protein n=1 Tax=Nocardiopsis eucommiae TaxID=2831970 RepID=A0A975LC60_9ACTN|nr:ketopantoate reductase family protein [Nocardiopsis eucommiae]
MKLLVYGAGVCGSQFAVRMHQAGHDVALLARGERLTALRRHGVRLAEEDASMIEQVPVPVVEHPEGAYDLITVFVRAHQVDGVMESLADVPGDVLSLLNWAGGPEALSAGIGRERLLLGFPTTGGTMDGDVVRHRRGTILTRRVPIPVGEPDGRTTPRLERVVKTFRAAGINARAEPRMDAWLRTHAASSVPLERAAYAAGGPEALADDPEAVRAMVHAMRRNLASLETPTVPRAFTALRALPDALLVPVFQRFLRSPTAVHSGLSDSSTATVAELERLTEQLRGPAGAR